MSCETIREILARYGVLAETVPLHGEDVTPLGEALERRESPLAQCANGCDRPPDPPSLVICRPCQDAITAKFDAMIASLDARAKGSKVQP